MKSLSMMVPLMLVGSALAALPSVREDDEDYVPQIYQTIYSCVDAITWASDAFWEANCMEYCWHFAHHPEDCGLAETPEDFNVIIDCILARHPKVCSDSRVTRSPSASVASLTTKNTLGGAGTIHTASQAAAAVTSAHTTTTEFTPLPEWIEFCKDNLYNLENDTWHEYCKDVLCTHYADLGWPHCSSTRSGHEFSQCIVARHDACKYWNPVDPSPQEECVHKMYETHGTGCVSICDTCEGSTAQEVYECALAKTATDCVELVHGPKSIPI